MSGTVTGAPAPGRRGPGIDDVRIDESERRIHGARPASEHDTALPLR